MLEKLSQKESREYCAEKGYVELNCTEEDFNLEKSKRSGFIERTIEGKIDKIVANNFYQSEYGVSRSKFWQPRKKIVHTMEELR